MTDKSSTLFTGAGSALPLLSMFAGGLVHSLLPRGAFGTYDVAIRAGITGTVVAATFLLLYAMSGRAKQTGPTQSEADAAV